MADHRLRDVRFGPRRADDHRGAEGQWSLTASTLVLQLRTYDMDTDLPGPVEDLGGFVKMVGVHEFRLMRGGETTTFYRCSNAP